MVATLISSDNAYFKLSGVTNLLFHEFNYDDGLVPYNPRTILNENQCYFLENFSRTTYCPELLKVNFSSTDYDEFSREQNKDHLVNINGELYFFQRITKALLKPKKFLKLMGSQTQFEQVDNGDSITIKEVPDAIYNKEKDQLYFWKLEWIKSLFPGIEELYREATDEEVEEFLQYDFIEVDESFNVTAVKTMNRKRIALLKDKYESFNAEQRAELKKYIRNYESDLPFVNGKFKIQSDQDVKKLLYGIDQRYYTTPIENEPRIANSVTKID